MNYCAISLQASGAGDGDGARDGDGSGGGGGGSAAAAASRFLFHLPPWALARRERTLRALCLARVVSSTPRPYVRGYRYLSLINDKE